MSTTILGTRFGKDPLDDPIVTEWDAVVGDGPLSDPDWDADRVALLRQFHALDDIPMPSPRFFDGLEQHLAGIAPAQLTLDRQTTDSIDSRKMPRRLSVVAPDRDNDPRVHRWMRLAAAAAMLAFVSLAGLFVLYRAVPSPSEAPAIPAAIVAQPELQPMMQFDFEPPLWGMPEATSWTHMDLSFVELAPGKSFSTDSSWYTSFDGPFLMVVLDGEVDLQLKGPAIVYPADRTRQPQPIDPGQTVRLGPNDAIVYSIMDTAIGVNPGTFPAIALFGLTGSQQVARSSPSAYSFPPDLGRGDFQYDDEMPSPSTTSATVSMEHLELEPYNSFVLDLDASLTYMPLFDSTHADGLSIAKGAFDGWAPNVQTIRISGPSGLRFIDPGPHTLFNLGPEPIDIYFLVIEPYSNLATPTP
jgi:hypothetical protein